DGPNHLLRHANSGGCEHSGYLNQLQLPQQVASGGVDQGDGVCAVWHQVAVFVRPRADGDAAHRVPSDHGALPRTQSGVQDRVQVVGEVLEAVAVPGHLAFAVAAVVECDDPVVGGEVGDLVCPDAQGAGDAVAQDDRVAVLGAE